jgi:ATP-dependent DNA ligase
VTIVASNAAGVPDFADLHRRTAAPGMLHLWAFDLLALHGRDWWPYSLEKRQARLQALLERFDCPAVLPSKTYDDAPALLRHRFEGVVSRRRGSAYRTGNSRD